MRRDYRQVSRHHLYEVEKMKGQNIYLLLTEFEGRTVSYGPSFFLLDLWPTRFALGP